MDAAIATSFALGALEPWMSGIGGIGTMVLYRASDKRFEVIDFGGSSPAGLNPDDYPLSNDGTVSDLFPWKRVLNDRNIHGAGSVAIPGVVAGMGEAHRRYGNLPWKDLVTPAAQLASAGLIVDWFTTENIAAAAGDLLKYPTAREEFLINGLPPVAQWGVKTQVRLPRPRYGKSLQWIAEQGADAFYRGALAQTMANELEAAGGPMRPQDFANYKVRVTKSLAIPYRNAVVHASPELTAGPTLAQTLKQLSAWAPDSSAPNAQTYAAYCRALQAAYKQRLSDMGDADGKRAIGAEHLSPNCTTHFNVSMPRAIWWP